MSIIAYKTVPAELTTLQQWLLWRFETRDDKLTKVPYTIRGSLASTTSPADWSTWEAVSAALAASKLWEGPGFVFSEADPFCGVDLDGIWQSDADEGASWALRILERFCDTYSEVSPSGQGVKIWCKARAPRCGKWLIEHGGIEIYDRSRFFTVTGQSAGIRVITDHQADVEALVANLDQDRYHHNVQARVIPGVIPQGGRHHMLLSLAGTMFRRGMTLEAIEAALVITDEKQCDPPRGPDHIHNKIMPSVAKWRR
jgi:primase-polymerase (primpol)-like protein